MKAKAFCLFNVCQNTFSNIHKYIDDRTIVQIRWRFKKIQNFAKTFLVLFLADNKGNIFKGMRDQHD